MQKTQRKTLVAKANIRLGLGVTGGSASGPKNERATTSGLMMMADNIPRAASSSISGGMMSGSDFYTPFLFTTLTYFVSSSLLYILFRKAKQS